MTLTNLRPALKCSLGNHRYGTCVLNTRGDGKLSRDERSSIMSRNACSLVRGWYSARPLRSITMISHTQCVPGQKKKKLCFKFHNSTCIHIPFESISLYGDVTMTITGEELKKIIIWQRSLSCHTSFDTDTWSWNSMFCEGPSLKTIRRFWYMRTYYKPGSTREFMFSLTNIYIFKTASNTLNTFFLRSWILTTFRICDYDDVIFARFHISHCFQVGFGVPREGWKWREITAIDVYQFFKGHR